MKEMPGQSGFSHPKTTGIVIGFAFGVAVSTLLFFRLGGYFFFLLLPFVGLAPVAIGPAIGVFLAWVGAVPYIRRIPMIALAVIIASTSFMSGYVEIRLRGQPFPILADAVAIQWAKYPSGERVLTFGSPEEVPTFFDRLVRTATEAGWNCRFCNYQSSTGTGHASFDPPDAAAGGPRGYLRFEVWPGEMALYGTAQSELSQVRIFHDLPTRSPSYAVLVVSSLLLAAIILHLLRK